MKTLTRATKFAPTTYDAETNTIEMEVSTENALPSASGYRESLSHESSAIDLSWHCRQRSFLRSWFCSW